MLRRTHHPHYRHLRVSLQTTFTLFFSDPGRWSVLLVHIFCVSIIQEASNSSSPRFFCDVNQSMDRETQFQTRILIYMKMLMPTQHHLNPRLFLGVESNMQSTEHFCNIILFCHSEHTGCVHTANSALLVFAAQ